MTDYETQGDAAAEQVNQDAETPDTAESVQADAEAPQAPAPGKARTGRSGHDG